ncbi:MAG: 5-formyltetrahydrofolate cyclo-ligase [Myxococcota bacterium]
MSDAKSGLRRRMRATLATVPADEAESAGIAVAHRVAALSIWSAPTTVALYASLPGELATRTLIEAAWQAGHRVLLPRVVGPGVLVFAEHRDGAPLAKGAFGVAEPGEGAPVVGLAEAQLIAVPGLAFDRLGGRLGRGAGYYDRALASLGPPRAAASETAAGRVAPRAIGLAFDRQLVASVPMDAHDVRLDAVATPSALHLLGGTGEARSQG